MYLDVFNQTFILLFMERMSNFINARVEELREHLKKYYDETIYLETRLNQVERENKKLREENDMLLKEKVMLREYCDELDSECDDLVVTKELLEWDIRILKREKKLLEKEVGELREENKILKAFMEHYKKFEEWKKELEWMLTEEGTLQ